MKRFLPLLLLLTGCSTTTPKSEKYQMEMTLHKTRADIEELKHDLHTEKMELSILEGKMLNHEDQMISLKKDTFDLHQTKLENCYQQILSLERKLSGLEFKQEEVASNLQKLAQSSGEMSKAISQSKDKINEMERSLATQAKSGNEVARIKKDVEKVSRYIEQNPKRLIVENYRIKSGDTLDTIAKEFGTTSDTLRKMNQLQSEKVVTGQEIYVPCYTQ